jgi:hypothetical protein
MAVTPTTARGSDAAAGRSAAAAAAARALGPPSSGEAGPARSRPLATASSEDEIDRQTNRLQDLLDIGDRAFDARARRGTYLNIVI